MLSPTFRLLAFTLLLIVNGAFTSTPAQVGEESPLFGPVTVLRETGKPTKVTFTFPRLSGFEAPFRLVVVNGGEGEPRSRVSSASISLNGEVVLSPSDLNQNVSLVRKNIDLEANNTLTVKLMSQPGSFLKVTVVGQKTNLPEEVLDQTSVNVGPGGGSAALDNFADVTLPESVLRPPLILKLEKILSASKTALYSNETSGTGQSLPEILRITSSVNMNDSLAAAIKIPPAFVNGLPPGLKPELFMELTQIGATGEIITSYERLGAIYDPIMSIAYVNLPKHSFTPINGGLFAHGLPTMPRRTNGTSHFGRLEPTTVVLTDSVTTSIVVGSYPDAPTTQVTGTNISPSQAVEAAPNQTIPLSANLTFSIPPQIGNPLPSLPTPSSGFGPRSHPVSGQPGFHEGVDLPSNAQVVRPVLPGRVVATGPQSPCTLVNGVCRQGFGHRVRIDHGNGLTSVYGHLDPAGLPALNAQVTTATQIGTSDTTGTSTNPHLHLEYRINGNPVDPMQFIGGQNAAGYLTNLSVVALVDGQAVEATRRSLTGVQINGSTATFAYNASLDLTPLHLEGGSTHELSLVVQNAGGASANISTVQLSINSFPLRVILTWDKYDTDVDLHVTDSLGNHSWYGNLCGIPNGCLDRDDVDGFGPEVFDLTSLAPGVTYTVYLHYFSDHGNGPTTARVVVEQGTQTFGPFVRTLSSGQNSTIGVFPQ